MFMWCTESEYLLYAASLLLGTIFAVDANVPPLLFMDVYGADYTRYLKNFQKLSFVLGTFSSALLPYIYDFTGSYNVIFMLGIIWVAVSMVTCWWLKGWTEKKKKTI